MEEITRKEVSRMVKTDVKVELNAQRMGEIALKVLKYIIKKKGITLSQGFVRELGDVAKNVNVPLAELKSFVQILLREIETELFRQDSTNVH